MKAHYLYSESSNFKPNTIPNPEDVEFIIVDLFCGAGGTTTGFDRARLNGNTCALVIACVNHDAKAIRSHWENHPEVVHFEEDIRTLDLTGLINIVEVYRILYPNAKLILWASLECTNFSKAKGGQPRDADSRTLAEHLLRYITAIDPNYVQIENVVEFMSWGPLDENGKPVSRRNGSDWMKWRKSICKMGYRDEWKELNSANFGAYTSRNRLFGCFAKSGLPIVWPEPTHAKKPEATGLFGGLKTWKAVKDVLDFDDEGQSIFTRKKPLSPKTLERIYAGLVKYVAGGKENFILKYNSTSKNGKHTPPSTDAPCPTVAVQNRLGVCFIQKHYSGKPEGKVIPVTGPAGTITTTAGQSLVQAQFLMKYYGSGGQLSSVNDPAGTLPTKDRMAKVQTVWLDQQYGQSTCRSVENPAGTITATPKMNKVQTVPFLMNHNYDNGAKSVDQPAPTLMASRKHYYLVSQSGMPINIKVKDDDSEVMVKIKEFMALYGIGDIKMRMLKVSELLPIQGFPRDYKLYGNQSDQKKFIGNSVVPHVVKSWCETMATACQESRKEAA